MVRLHFILSASLEFIFITENSFSKCLESKQYTRNAICERKMTSEFSKDIQCRQHVEDSFYTIVYCGNYNWGFKYGKEKQSKFIEKKSVIQCRYKIFESTKSNSSKLIANIFSDESFQITLSLNGHFYFLSRRSIKIYSISSNNWTNTIKYPAEVSDFCACTFMGKIYILGGSRSFNDFGLKSCIVFNRETNKWNETATIEQRKFCVRSV